MTDEKFIDREARERISRLEGIIEEIRTRLSSLENEMREVRQEINSVKHAIWAGLVFIIGLLVKIAFFN